MDKVKSTIMKGLGRSSHADDMASQTKTEQQRTSSIDQASQPAPSSRSRVPGHIEPDFSDMTAEWEPNPVERSGDQRTTKGVFGGNSSATSKQAVSFGKKKNQKKKNLVTFLVGLFSDHQRTDTTAAKEQGSGQGGGKILNERTVLIGEHFGS